MTTPLTTDPARDPAAGLLPFRRYTWWSLAIGFGLLLLMPQLPWIAPDPLEPAWQLLGWLALAVVAAAAIALLQRRLPLTPRPEPDDPRGHALPMPWVVAGSSAAVVVGGISRAGGDVLFWAAGVAVLVAMVATYLERPARTWFVAWSCAAVGMVGAITSWVLQGEVHTAAVTWPAGVVAFACFTSLASLWTWQIAAELDAARRVAGRMAVADERLRFAGDLHDIQGHHLQVIALKSELATRLVDTDASAAAEQMREVRELAAEALRDTREIVYDLRRTSLDAEIMNATGVLAAADIDGRMQIDPALDLAELSDTSRHLLGLVVREAVTNILRHSDARSATVRVALDGASVHLEVINDGVPGDGSRDRDGPPGGLAALTSRLEPAGGALTWDHDGDIFRLRAVLPARAEPRVDA